MATYLSKAIRSSAGFFQVKNNQAEEKVEHFFGAQKSSSANSDKFREFFLASVAHEENLTPSQIQAHRDSRKALIESRHDYLTEADPKLNQQKAIMLAKCIDAYKQTRSELGYPEFEEFELTNPLTESSTPSRGPSASPCA